MIIPTKKSWLWLGADRQIPISYYISVDVIKHLHLFLYNEGSNWPDGIPIGLSHPFDKQSAIPLL